VKAGRQDPVMADVAAHAGVSVMTVSRVINDFPGVRAETRARVQSVIDSLGYRSNTAARTLAGGRSRILGVIGVETRYFGPSHTIFGIEAAARSRDHFVNLVTLPEVSAREMRAGLGHLRDVHADGAIVLAPSQDAVDALISAQPEMPIVIISGRELPGFVTVAFDQDYGAQLATRHLLELGHATVHHLRGPRRWLEADAREAGWRAELDRHAARCPRPLVGNWSPRSGYRQGLRLAADPAVTAVFVANDQMAMGVLLACAESGRRIPQDISVVGFDDTPESAYCIPPLTTVRQDFDALGRKAVQSLLHRIEGSAETEHLEILPRLLVRRSSGGPAVAGRDR
jgi:DNA-binding LacI/PurR family transcriptional regulator